MQTLNLSTRCIEHLVSTCDNIQHSLLQELFSALITELRAAPKFLLPDGGRVLDDGDSVARLYDQLRLPFPCVALEYEARGAINDAIETRSSRRIALAWDLRHGVPNFVQLVTGFDARPQQALVVQSLAFIDDMDLWTPVMGLVRLDLDDDVLLATIAEHALADPAHMALVQHRLTPQKSNDLVQSYSTQAIAYPVPPVFRSATPNTAQMLSNISADTDDELLAVIAFAALTSCANVEFDVLPAAKKLNTKRAAKNKEPFYDVRVLMLAGQGYRATAISSGKLGELIDSGSPKRTHLRRGHVRKLPGKNVWINAAVINAGHGGARTPAYKLS